MNKLHEIRFWRKRADKGVLIQSIRSHQKRAISFFGAVAVFSENEADLFRTLEAYIIVISAEEDLLAEMNQPHVEAIASLNLSPTELSSVTARILLKHADIFELKKKARHQLLHKQAALRMLKEVKP